MNRRRALGAVAALAALPLLAACPGGNGNQTSDDTGGDKPHCDLGDLLEGDKDCDLKTKKPPADADKKPKPRKTKRP